MYWYLILIDITSQVVQKCKNTRDFQTFIVYNSGRDIKWKAAEIIENFEGDTRTGFNEEH